MPFHIVSETNEGPKTETRVLPASAAVLAMKWIQEGLQRVRIECQGRGYQLAEFRRRFMNGRHKLCP